MLHRALKTLRSFHRLSQVELARRLNISNSYLSEIESGIKKPGLDLLEQYELVFQIPVSSILLFSEELGQNTLGRRIQVKAANKVLKMLEWIAETEEISDAN